MEALPSGVVLSESVFGNFLQHFTASLFRDACVDGYVPQGLQATAVREVLPQVAPETWKRLCMRHEYSESPASSHTHWDRNFVLCQVFRGDRETPLIIKNIWRECDKAVDVPRWRNLWGPVCALREACVSELPAELGQDAGVVAARSPSAVFRSVFGGLRPKIRDLGRAARR